MSGVVVGHTQKITVFYDSLLGCGEFGSVYGGLYADKQVVVKSISIHRTKAAKGNSSLKSEIALIKESKNRNVVTCLYDDEDVHSFYIVMKKCRCSLRTYFSKNGYAIMKSGNPRLQIFYHATSGLSYLHSKKIIHRDIKMSNLLLYEEDYKVLVQIADFGLSKKMEPDQTSTSTIKAGTAGYKACEVLLGRKIKVTSDIFSLGITFHEMLSEGEHPFSDDDDNKDYQIKKMKEPRVLVTEADLRTLVRNMIDHHNRWPLKKVKEAVVAKFLNKGRKIAVGSTEFSQAEIELEKPIDSASLGWDTPVCPQDASAVITTTTEEPRQQFVESVHASLRASPLKRTNARPVVTPASKKSKLMANNRKLPSKIANPKKALETYAEKEKLSEKDIKPQSENIDDLLKTTEMQAYRGHWNDALESLDNVLSLLDSYSSITAQFFQQQSEKCTEKADRRLRAILFRVCEAKQHRAEQNANEGCFKTGQCVQKIFSLTKTMIPTEVRREMAEGVRFKDVALHFVCPTVQKMYENVEETRGIFPQSLAKNKAYALCFIARLHMAVQEIEKAHEFVRNGINILKKAFLAEDLKTLDKYARLLDCEGEVYIRLREFSSAKTVLEESLAVRREAKDCTEKAREDGINFTQSLLKQIPEKHVAFQD